MHKGVSLQATYTYSHSIDDASSVGGSGGTIAQNDQDLGAEESNSSFDRRHVLSGNFVIEPPFGPNRAFFNKGGVCGEDSRRLLHLGQLHVRVGRFQTPIVRRHGVGDCGGRGEFAAAQPRPGPVDQGARQRRRSGSTQTRSPDCAARRRPARLRRLLPAAGVYGNASRNSIELPGNGVSQRIAVADHLVRRDARPGDAAERATTR